MQLMRSLTGNDNRDDRGASAVILGLSMTVMLSFSAIALNYATGVQVKAATQDGTEAAALAVAQECAMNSPHCNSAEAPGIAQNSLDTFVSGGSLSVSALTSTSKSVTVTSQKTDPTTLSGPLGADNYVVTGEATASWDNVPIAGTPAIPLGIGFCDWDDHKPAAGASAGTSYDIIWNTPLTTGFFNSNSNSCDGAPIGRSGSTVYNPQTSALASLFSGTKTSALWLTNGIVPGWNLWSCDYSPSLWDAYSATFPTALTVQPCMVGRVAALEKGETYLMPLYAYGQWSIWGFNTGITTSVSIVGFAPFTIDSFIPPKAIWPFPQSPAPSTCNMGTGISLLGYPLGGNCIGLTGHFTQTTRAFDGWQYGNTTPSGDAAYNLGASDVRLIPTP